MDLEVKLKAVFNSLSFFNSIQFMGCFENIRSTNDRFMFQKYEVMKFGDNKCVVTKLVI